MSGPEYPLRAALGERAKAFRKARGHTLRELAEKSGLSTRFLSQVESGQANPSLESMHELAKALGVHIFTLVGQGALHPERDALHEIVDALTPGEIGRAVDALRPIRRPPTSIVLLGLRGAGKSTVGQALARDLGWAFHEVDALVEAEAGMSLAGMFELHGERHYREVEHQVLAGLLATDQPPSVIAPSGGVVKSEESWSLLKERSSTVWLRAPPQAHWDRVLAQGDMRPMGGRSRARAELEELYARRAPRYAEADLVIDTAHRDVQAVVEAVKAAVFGGAGQPAAEAA